MTAEHAVAAGGEVQPLAERLHAWLEGRGWCAYSPKSMCVHTSRARDLAGLIEADYIGPARNTAADTVLATARRLCCGDNPAPEHNARADHSQRMAFAEQLARAVRGS